MSLPDIGPQPYVVVGEWIDAEWLALSKATTRPLTLAETRRLIDGPRRHPFGPEAVQIMRDGQVVVYPNLEVAEP